MPRKPESNFIASINRKLPPQIRAQAMGSGFSNGTPDRWYSGKRSDLWVEYKFFQRLPAIISLIDPRASVKLSPLQQKWLNDEYDKGRNVCVIAGYTDMGVILTDRQWNANITKETFCQLLLPRREIVEWLIERIEGSIS